jgi:hypothetical protein
MRQREYVPRFCENKWDSSFQTLKLPLKREMTISLKQKKMNNFYKE